MGRVFSSESILSLFILVLLEIILGIDNVIFVSIIIYRLPAFAQKKARLFWIIQGMIVRSFLILGLSWLLTQKGHAIVTWFGKGFDLASLVMLGGGVFLIYKSVVEIHQKLEGDDLDSQQAKPKFLSSTKATFRILQTRSFSGQPHIISKNLKRFY